MRRINTRSIPQKRSPIARPELYVVYTGNRKDIPDTLRLSDLYEGSGSVEVEVKVLRGENPQQILGQYVEFCKISNEQVFLHGKTDAAATKTIRICLERRVLVPFLSARQKEVHDIMRTLFSKEAVWDIERYNIRQEGREEGWSEGTQAMVLSLQKFLKDQALVAKEVAEQFGPTQEVATKSVQQYWKNYHTPLSPGKGLLQVLSNYFPRRFYPWSKSLSAICLEQPRPNDVG